MRIEKQEIPESMKKDIVIVSPSRPKENDSGVILKEIRDEEIVRKRDNVRATFFVNLVYLMGLILSAYMMTQGDILYALPSLVFVTLGAFVFNIFIYNESKRTKKHIETIDNIYPYENKKDNKGRTGSTTQSC